MLPQTTTVLSDEQKAQFDQLIEKLEDDDDVSEVYTSIEE
jgi:transcriptional/translational regulatory protein YebC/TACO1